MTAIIRWDAELTALSSIAHGGEQLGTISLLRREKVLLPMVNYCSSRSSPATRCAEYCGGSARS